MLTPNLAELELAVGAQLDELESIAAAATTIAASHRIGMPWTTYAIKRSTRLDPTGRDVAFHQGDQNLL